MEKFERIIGQDRPIKIIDGFIRENKLPHALLFWGPPGVGKFTFSLVLASILNNETDKVFKGIHPDVMIFFPEFKGYDREEVFNLRREGRYYRLRDKQANIMINEIREIKRNASMTPYQGRRKVFIIVQAERMTKEAMNAFLKVLEEPASDNLFILITPYPDMLPETVRSRTTGIRFRTLSKDELRSIVQNMGEEFLDLGLTYRGVEDYFFVKDNIDLIEKIDKLFLNRSPEERFREALDDMDVQKVLRGLILLIDSKAQELAVERLEKMLNVIKRAYQYLRGNVNEENVLKYLLLEV